MSKLTKKLVLSQLNRQDDIPQFFEEIYAFVLPNGMGKTRQNFFQNAILKHGGSLIDDTKPIDLNISYLIIIFDENTIKNWHQIDFTLSKRKFYQSLKILYDQESMRKAFFVQSSWLSECLKQKNKIPISSYEIFAESENLQNETGIGFSLKRKNSDSYLNKEKKSKISDNHDSTTCHQIKTKIDQKYEIRSDSSTDFEEDLNLLNEKILKNFSSKSNFFNNNTNWTCSHSSKEQHQNLNKHITDKLEQLLSIYENNNEKYKALGYQKAILILKRHPKEIESKEVIKYL